MNRFKKYAETEKFLFGQLVMYQKDGPKAIKKGLDNILSLVNNLKNPQDSYPIIHIAGTNGKGSVAHMIASLLQAQGLRIGMYTSPHYKTYRERIKINGNYIKKKEVTAFVNKIYPIASQLNPTFFEMSVAMAFDYFCEKKVDLAIIETGLGGRLDSTNIVNPILSIITNISWDHQATLGNTLSEIAKEKAGIIKINTPVLIGEYDESISLIFKQHARNSNSSIYWSNELIKFKRLKKNKYKITDIKTGQLLSSSVILSSSSKNTLKNWKTALAACLILNNSYPDLNNTMCKGISQMSASTKYIGRWQLINKCPRIIVDSAHNEAAQLSLVNSIGKIKHKNLFIVIGMVKGKDHLQLLNILPKNARYFYCKANLPRCIEAHELHKLAVEVGLKGRPYKSVKKAIKAAKKISKSKNDLIIVTGSSFVVGEAI